MASMTRQQATRSSSIFLTIVLAACGGPTEPSDTTPTPTPTATPAPAVTFSVSGWVFDSVSRPLAGARVEVLTGTRAGTVLVTDGQGQFAFDQPLDLYVQVRASLTGYIDHVRVVGTAAGVTPNTHRMAFSLSSTKASVDLKGHHRITFTADADCTDLPPVARVRSYLADVFSAVDLYGAKFGVDTRTNYLFSTLYFSQFEDYAVFHLSDPPVWELLPDNAYVVIYGEAKGNVDHGGGTLPMWGFFSYCPRMKMGEPLTCEVPEPSCQSSRHQMTIARQF